MCINNKKIRISITITCIFLVCNSRTNVCEEGMRVLVTVDLKKSLATYTIEYLDINPVNKCEERRQLLTYSKYPIYINSPLLYYKISKRSEDAVCNSRV